MCWAGGEWNGLLLLCAYAVVLLIIAGVVLVKRDA
jgi:hypothetical protein